MKKEININNEWEAGFDEKFVYPKHPIYKDNETGKLLTGKGRRNTFTPNRVKSFIRETLQAERRRWEEKFLNQPANEHDQEVIRIERKRIAENLKRSWDKNIDENGRDSNWDLGDALKVLKDTNQ